MHFRISIRGCVHRSVRASVRPSHTRRNGVKVPFLTKIDIDKGLKQESMTELLLSSSSTYLQKSMIKGYKYKRERIYSLNSVWLVFSNHAWYSTSDEIWHKFLRFEGPEGPNMMANGNKTYKFEWQFISTMHFLLCNLLLCVCKIYWCFLVWSTRGRSFIMYYFHAYYQARNRFAFSKTSKFVGLNLSSRDVFRFLIYTFKMSMGQ